MMPRPSPRVCLTLAPALAILLASCAGPGSNGDTVQPAFELLTSETTHLSFTNSPELSEKLNVFNYMYFYNGGGLACGDFNGDGRPDLYFTANDSPNALFLNEGNLAFREVTEAAGLAGAQGWTTGVSVVDINQDGLLDLYVMQVSGTLDLPGRNQLYLNQGPTEEGVPVFTEAAEAYGLAQQGYGTQAVFFDYDGDGDLDCFQLNHSVHQNGTFGPRDRFDVSRRHPLAGDRLLRNDGPPEAGGGFTDVSEEAGILGTALGYGLGVALGDINNDGWPDIYVGNDFHENDYLYLNQGDGTFRESLTEMMDHTSRFTMGVDLADLNADGLTEIFSLDMLPDDPVILKQSLAEDGYDVFRFKLGFGYNPQFSRNALQLNNGDGSFSEIAAQAGIMASDWSWAPLFFDMDNDGRMDLFISNGIPRRMNDIDWINFKTSDNQRSAGASAGHSLASELADIDRMPQIKLANKFYRSDGPLHFTDQSNAVTGNRISYSNSAVYADLDQDGDLDVVTNNIEDSPFVYRNLQRDGSAAANEEAGDYLDFSFVGAPGNRNAIGASVVLFSGGSRRRFERFPARGFQSSALGPLQVGIGDRTTLDSVLIIWPDRSYESFVPDASGHTVELVWRPDLPAYDFERLALDRSGRADLTDIAGQHGIAFAHTENNFIDFNREPLIPHRISTEGPALEVGDLNGDGLDDFFVGSAKMERSAVYVQDASGHFTELVVAALIQDSTFEDVDATFVDLDQDGDLDLVVAAGGNEYEKQQDPRRQRSYLNDGRGNLTRHDVLPDLFLTASAVEAADYDRDGRVDLLVTGRVVPFHYGEIPHSYLFRNLGNLRFVDVTEKVAPALRTAGLITDAQWADLDGDGDQDFVLAREWGTVVAFFNDGERFTPSPLTDGSGWWTTLDISDVDGDGRLDVLAGNYGANNKFHPTPDRPVRLHLNDFDGNGKQETILTYFLRDREIPFANYAELTKQLPGLKKRYIYARDLANAELPELFGRDAWHEAEVYEINTLESVLLLQGADGSFQTHPLPAELQRSSLNAFQRIANGAGGEARFLAGGNFLGANIEMGWYDAGRLSIFSIDRSAKVTVVGGYRGKSGVVRNIRSVRLAGDSTAFLVGRNADSLLLLQ